MHTHFAIIALLAPLAITGCGGIDPCTNDALFPHLTPEQQEDCEEPGETEGGEVVQALTCEGAAYGRLCIVGELVDRIAHPALPADPFTYPPDESIYPLGWHLESADDCTALSEPFPCEGTWSGDFAHECVICDVHNGIGGGQHFGLHSPASLDNWPLAHYPPLTLDPVEMGPMPTDWPAHLYGEGPGFFQPCGPGHTPVQLNTTPGAAGYEGITGGKWTCSCESDTDCQPGAVCEAGWQWDGLWPGPTLCTMSMSEPDGPPAGPVVYGLDQWSDGIAIEGGRVTVTVPMYVELRSGAFNDDQRFSSAGLVEHCGPDALCSHFGLVEGDIIDAWDFDPDAFERGEPQAVGVTSERGYRELSVALAL